MSIGELNESEGGQGPGGVPGVVPGGGSNVMVASHFDDSDGEVAQADHDLGPVSGADLGGVFAVGDVADVVQGFDGPVTADPPGEVSGAGLGDGQAGDAIGGDGPPLAGGQRPDAAGDGDGLGRVREGKPGRDGGGLIVRCSSRPCPRVCWRSPAGMARQGRFLTWAYKLGWFFFTIRM
jgi:hypothetical protein